MNGKLKHHSCIPLPHSPFSADEYVGSKLRRLHPEMNKPPPKPDK